MDSNFFIDFLKMIVLLPVILMLIYITLKYGSKYMGKFTGGKVIKVHERVPLGQNVFLSVVTIGDKPYVVTNGEKGAHILLELNEDIIKKYEINQGLDKKFSNVDLAGYIEKIKGKVKNEKA